MNENNAPRILVSACLAGEKCRYDGNDNCHHTVKQWVEEGKAITVCPEVLGGMSTPRCPSEIKMSDRIKVMSRDGDNVTVPFLDGAKKTVEIAKQNQVELAVMKSKSPSCGCGVIYDGTFSGKLTTGDGITVQALKKEGIAVISEKDI